uniref:Nucleotide-diphospho-sugar transferase domain-containing protein n=1 Tax=viral metagenome TaxID=1070528 RepID=A0A6C0B7V2_9ZZZZ
MHFITFGSHANYIDAAIRLCNQAYPFYLFTTITAYTGAYLKKDKTFWKQHGEFITKHKRGFGYWLWKPYLILKTMNQLKDGEIILYLDCGCELDLSEKKYLIDSIEIVKKDKIIGSDTQCMEKVWNKRDLIEFLDMDKDEHTSSSQRQAGALMIFVCDETRKLVNEWYQLSCDYHNIDDSPSILPNCTEFKEHRHDQSIFSLLTKKYNVFSTTCIDTYCIKYLRNRSGSTKLQPITQWCILIVYFIYVAFIVLLVQNKCHLPHNLSVLQ